MISKTCIDKDNKLVFSKELNHINKTQSCSKLLFSYGEGSSILLREPSYINPYFPETTIAKLEIDTTCLCNPKIKVNFNSIISYQGNLGGTNLRLLNPFTITFQLSKTCNLGEKIPLESWTYANGNISANTTLSNSFNFIYCDSSCDSGCCVYTVEIIRLTGSLIAGVSPTVVENVYIKSSNISALAFSESK
ncbi:DUF4489 domain-containing protein [Clostridium ihumii]|uniref:DUF4489 domain-containing protein n=1 Tax=Clostridium ihumii TaxID=1470356 RepID=UPI003D353021